jgi:hypothetical protein
MNKLTKWIKDKLGCADKDSQVRYVMSKPTTTNITVSKILPKDMPSEYVREFLANTLADVLISNGMENIIITDYDSKQIRAEFEIEIIDE